MYVIFRGHAGTGFMTVFTKDSSGPRKSNIWLLSVLNIYILYTHYPYLIVITIISYLFHLPFSFSFFFFVKYFKAVPRYQVILAPCA